MRTNSAIAGSSSTSSALKRRSPVSLVETPDDTAAVWHSVLTVSRRFAERPLHDTAHSACIQQTRRDPSAAVSSVGSSMISVDERLETTDRHADYADFLDFDKGPSGFAVKRAVAGLVVVLALAAGGYWWYTSQ